MHHREDTRHRFSEALDGVLRSTVELGALVLDNVRRGSEALLENRLDVARTVIDADGEIDEKYSALEQRVFEIMARQQPVAGDLRFLVSITRILYDIERSGDLAVNCAKGLIRREGYTLPPAIHSLLARMSRSSAELFHKGLEALAALDASAGRRLDVADDEVDDLVGELYSAIAGRSDDIGFDVAIELSRVGRYMERIGDHAVNIAEHVTFIVTGEFPAQDEG
ncbi:MAG: phosphate transport system regulatory protein PhoU [Actinobacteria bacterium RBG_16_68_21]|nr:MAG: phosphate transport system regulatory protein PhoU [Actinobacteria bacterium RBG_16_68_21]